jgi:hypothetical protein
MLELRIFGFGIIAASILGVAIKNFSGWAYALQKAYSRDIKKAYGTDWAAHQVQVFRTRQVRQLAQKMQNVRGDSSANFATIHLASAQEGGRRFGETFCVQEIRFRCSRLSVEPEAKELAREKSYSAACLKVFPVARVVNSTDPAGGHQLS